MRCNVHLVGRDKAGRFAFRRRAKNLVVLAGRDLLVEMLGGTANAAPTHIALGTDNTAVVDGDTALGAEEYRDLITRRQAYSSRIQFQLFVDVGDGNGFTYEEAGIMNVRNGTSKLFARVTFDPIPKTSASTITVTWDITLTAS